MYRPPIRSGQRRALSGRQDPNYEGLLSGYIQSNIPAMRYQIGADREKAFREREIELSTEAQKNAERQADIAESSATSQAKIAKKRLAQEKTASQISTGMGAVGLGINLWDAYQQNKEREKENRLDRYNQMDASGWQSKPYVNYNPQGRTTIGTNITNPESKWSFNPFTRTSPQESAVGGTVNYGATPGKTNMSYGGLPKAGDPLNRYNPQTGQLEQVHRRPVDTTVLGPRLGAKQSQNLLMQQQPAGLLPGQVSSQAPVQAPTVRPQTVGQPPWRAEPDVGVDFDFDFSNEAAPDLRPLSERGDFYNQNDGLNLLSDRPDYTQPYDYGWLEPTDIGAFELPGSVGNDYGWGADDLDSGYWNTDDGRDELDFMRGPYYGNDGP